MKTERRHELETNTLAHELEIWTERFRPYKGVTTAVVGVLLGLYLVSTIWNASRSSRNEAAWDAYQKALIDDGDGIEFRELQRVAGDEQFAGTPMQEWAYVNWADRQVFLAADQYLSDREAANKRLTAVAAIYEQFAESGNDPEIRNRARLGLARVNELQNRLDEARTQYNLVDGPLSEYAQRRAKALESPQVKDDVQWLANVELPRRARPSGPGTPGVRPGFETPQPPVDAPSQLPIDSSKSLEDILGGLGDFSDDDDRYGDDAASDAPDDSASPATDDAVPSESPAEK